MIYSVLFDPLVGSTLDFYDNYKFLGILGCLLTFYRIVYNTRNN